MRIATIAVDGFGQFHGAHLEPAPGLTVVRGPNEAGKTTLLAFVRAILFGFETDRYPALSGGRRGGWLDIEMADGHRFQVERYGDRGGSGSLKVYDEHDTGLGEGYLAVLLQGVERKVYRNIFAFGLEELTQFERLTDSEVAARIYGAGLGTGSVSGLDVENLLRAEREALFKPGGHNPRINGLLRSLEETDDTLRGRDLTADFGHAGARLAEVERELAAVNDRHARLAAERHGRQRVIDGWSTWLDLLGARMDRDALGPVSAFPVDTLERLARLEEAQGAAVEAARSAIAERRRRETALAELVIDGEALRRREELEELIEAARIEATRRDERLRLNRELTIASGRTDVAIAQLGHGWTIGRVEEFDVAIAVHAELGGRMRTLLDRSDEALRIARNDFAALERGVAEISAELDAVTGRIAEITNAIGPRSPAAQRERAFRDVEEHRHRLDALREAAAGIPDVDLDSARRELRGRLDRVQVIRAAIDREQHIRDLLQGLVAPAAAAPRGRAFPVYAGPAAIAIGGVLLALLTVGIGGPPVSGLVIAAAAVVIAVARLAAGRNAALPADEGLRGQLERQLDDASATIGQETQGLGLGARPTDTEMAQLEMELDESRMRIERESDRRSRAESAAREAADVGRRLADLAETLGLPPEPSPDDLAAMEGTISEDRELESRRSGLAEQQARLQARLEDLARRRAEAASLVADCTVQVEEARSQWVAWLRAHDLDPALDRETAGRVVDAVAAAKESVATVRSFEARRDELEVERLAFVARVESLAELLPERRFDETDVDGASALLAARYATATAQQRARDGLVREVAEQIVVCEDAGRSLDAAEAALAALLAQTGAAEPDALRMEIWLASRAAEIDDRIAAATTALTVLSGPGEALAAFEADLATVADIPVVQVEVVALDDQLQALASVRDELNREAGGLRTQRAEIERDAAATVLRQRRADLQAELEAAAERWSVLALATEMLARSRTAYEEAHRPAVVEAAERYFTAWTDGRYQRIVAPIGRPIEGVERSDRIHVPLAGLSRGTSEQLYLALRLGLVERFIANAEALPIVMDDILVNFDDDRAARAARSIEELSARCQVIYFTCHPTTPLRPDLETTLRRLEAS